MTSTIGVRNHTMPSRAALLYVALLGIIVSSQAIAVEAIGPSVPEPAPAEPLSSYEMTQSWIKSLDEPYLIAPVLTGANAGDDADDAGDQSHCAKFVGDLDADIGDILRAGCKPSIGQMSALMDNPLGNVAMLFTQFDLYKMENDANGIDADQWNYMGILQFPKSISENWNLISRIIWTVPSVPIDLDNIDPRFKNFSSSPGIILPPSLKPPAAIDIFSGRTTGFGDMIYDGLFSPKEGIKLDNGASIVWGVGFDLSFPTASDKVLGTDRWMAGPSFLGVYLGKKWKIGALTTQFFDFAGDDDAADVNLTNIQYFVYYSLTETTSIGAAPNIIANWENGHGDVWTVPIGLGINTTKNIGKVPVRFGFEAHYSVFQPDNVPGADWDFRFYVIPAAPSALFKWMQ